MAFMKNLKDSYNKASPTTKGVTGLVLSNAFATAAIVAVGGTMPFVLLPVGFTVAALSASALNLGNDYGAG